MITFIMFLFAFAMILVSVELVLFIISDIKDIKRKDHENEK